MGAVASSPMAMRPAMPPAPDLNSLLGAPSQDNFLASMLGVGGAPQVPVAPMAAPQAQPQSQLLTGGQVWGGEGPVGQSLIFRLGGGRGGGPSGIWRDISGIDQGDSQTVDHQAIMDEFRNRTGLGNVTVDREGRLFENVTDKGRSQSGYAFPVSHYRPLSEDEIGTVKKAVGDEGYLKPYVPRGGGLASMFPGGDIGMTLLGMGAAPALGLGGGLKSNLLGVGSNVGRNISSGRGK